VLFIQGTVYRVFTFSVFKKTGGKQAAFASCYFSKKTNENSIAEKVGADLSS
jgi:hypothetical protein